MKIDRESIFRVTGLKLNVRVWRTEPDTKYEANNMFLIAYIESLLDVKSTKPLELAQKILNYHQVAAVEVTNKDGEGEVLYRNWPE